MEKVKATAQINEKRADLDQVDRELVRLFERRIGIARQIGAIKQDAGLPVLDASRERDVLASRRALLNDPELGDALEEFFKQLMQSSRQAQKKDMETQKNIENHAEVQ